MDDDVMWHERRVPPHGFQRAVQHLGRPRRQPRLLAGACVCVCLCVSVCVCASCRTDTVSAPHECRSTRDTLTTQLHAKNLLCVFNTYQASAPGFFPDPLFRIYTANIHRCVELRVWSVLLAVWLIHSFRVPTYTLTRTHTAACTARTSRCTTVRGASGRR
jgi:hypothetical protein